MRTGHPKLSSIFNYGSQLAKSLRRKQSCYSATGRRLEQQLRLKEEEKEAEIARLQEQMRQLATEKDRLASQKQREIAELRSQLQTSHKPPVQRGREAMTVSRPKASI